MLISVLVKVVKRKEWQLVVLNYEMGHDFSSLVYEIIYAKLYQYTLKKYQRALTFATVSKVSDIENEWRFMGILYFESFLRNKQRVVGNDIV